MGNEAASLASGRTWQMHANVIMIIRHMLAN